MNNTNQIESSNSKYKIINILSIAIPLAVAAIIGIKSKFYLGEWTNLLPHLIAIINSLTAIALLFGFLFIKQKKVNLHKVYDANCFCTRLSFFSFLHLIPYYASIYQIWW